MTTATLTPAPIAVDDPFDLDAALIVDPVTAGTPRRCATDDGCSPTCASACASQV